MTLDPDFAKENLVILLRCFSTWKFLCLLSSPVFFFWCHYLLCLETKLFFSRFELVLFFFLSFFDGFEQGHYYLGFVEY